MEIMQSDYKVRVEQEVDQLAEKTASLHNFIGSEVFESLSAREQGLLMVQHEAMKMYHNALIERIKLF
jgi:hypothetical protein